MQDCSFSIANVLEIPQFYTKPSMYATFIKHFHRGKVLVLRPDYSRRITSLHSCIARSSSTMILIGWDRQVLFFHNVSLNTLKPTPNGRHFPDDIFKCIFLKENVWISIKYSLRFVPKGLIDDMPTLVQIMTWRRPGDKPLSAPMMVSLPKHKCVTRLQWFKTPLNISMA